MSGLVNDVNNIPAGWFMIELLRENLLSSNRYAEFEKWFSENVFSDFKFMSVKLGSSSYILHFYFEDEAEALHCKLRWG